MRLTLTIELDNAAFHPSEVEEYGGHADGAEVASILRHAALWAEALELLDDGDSKRLMDANGNTVGRVAVTA
mgnify:CR=1 FL=1